MTNSKKYIQIEVSKETYDILSRLRDDFQAIFGDKAKIGFDKVLRFLILAKVDYDQLTEAREILKGTP